MGTPHTILYPEPLQVDMYVGAESTIVDHEFPSRKSMANAGWLSKKAAAKAAARTPARGGRRRGSGDPSYRPCWRLRW